MTDSHAVAAVTDTLRAVLQSAVGERVPGAQVDARPPDELAGEQGVRVLNVFLYRVCVASALRNEDGYGVQAGEVAPPALPLVLHYLLTPYVADDAENEVVAHQMLGAAMSRLHDEPLLRRSDLAEAAPYSDLHQQIERVRITPSFLTVDDISKLWTAFQSKYRTSAAYEARVVLIDSNRGGRAGLPVLRRGTENSGPSVAGSPKSPFPSLTVAVPPMRSDTALPGEEVTLEGVNLAVGTGGSAVARLWHRLLAEPVDVPATLPDPEHARFTVPDQPAALPAGQWSVSLALVPSGPDPVEQVTNEVPLSVAPRITSPLPMQVARDAGGVAVIELTCKPDVRPGQRVWLLLGSRQAAAGPIDAATNALTFRIERAEAGRHRLRLRVDGVDSPLVDHSVSPPAFDEDQAVTVT